VLLVLPGRVAVLPGRVAVLPGRVAVLPGRVAVLFSLIPFFQNAQNHVSERHGLK
jgi:hypothetical protein